MSRSIWAAVGASVLVFALGPVAAIAASPGSAGALSARTDAKADQKPAPRIARIIALHTPRLARHGRRPSAIGRLRRSAARALPSRHVVVLAAGSGYQQASGRVRGLQRRLAGLGFVPGPIDGRFGPLTSGAVKRFQSAFGLRVDGIVGVRTLAALNAAHGTKLFPGAGYQRASGRVRVLQRRLAVLGFAPGPIDGRYGPLTSGAVKRFQSAHDLSVNGIVGVHTLAALSVVGRRPAPLGRSPQGSPVPQDNPVPLGRRAPGVASVPARGARESSPARLPVAPVLLGLAALGLATILLSYARTRTRVRRITATGRLRAAEVLAPERRPTATRRSEGHLAARSLPALGVGSAVTRRERESSSPAVRSVWLAGLGLVMSLGYATVRLRHGRLAR